jgi:hypothetical protein
VPKQRVWLSPWMHFFRAEVSNFPDCRHIPSVIESLDMSSPLRAGVVPAIELSKCLGGARLWIDNGSATLTSLQQRLVKTGGRLVKHARYYWPLLAESHLTRRLFGNMVRRIAVLSLPAG